MPKKWAFLFVISVAAVAQSGRSYGPGNVWWNPGDGAVLPLEEAYDNPDGQVSVFNKTGAIHTAGHAFFERLGANGRACVTCHQPSNAMSLSVATINDRWTETRGKDPLFAAIDGSNCPDLPQDAMASHSLLLQHGLIRISLPRPKNADFRIEVVRDPTGCNKDNSTISVYRRPRVTANFRYVASDAFMADGREPSLRSQAITAAITHEEAATKPTEEQLRQILEFEAQVYTAQSADIRGGRLDAHGATGFLSMPVDLAQPLTNDFRSSVMRGRDLFTKDCSKCHDGKSSNWIDIGTTNPDATDLPFFRVTCNDSRALYTQDPGRALISGKCSDIGSVAAQQLRGLAARAPYFINGSARTLDDVVAVHERHLHRNYTAREKQDLVNLLRVL